MKLSSIRRILSKAKDSDIEWAGMELIHTMVRYHISTPLRQAHFLAQIGHETGELRYREEIASGRAYEGRKDLGNIHPGDGRKFKGRGSIQCTGRSNYAEYDQFKRLDGLLLREPERLVTDPVLFADVGGWYWHTRDLNRWADDDDLPMLTKKVNGGYNGLRDRQRLLDIAKSVLIPIAEEHSVAELQMRLNALDEDLSVDGVIGPRTRAAIIRFQSRSGLVPDGIPGPKTWGALLNERP